MSEENAPNEEWYEKAKAREEAHKQSFVGQVEELKKAVREFGAVLATVPLFSLIKKLWRE